MGGMINQDIINAQQAEINRLCAELADARLERDNIAALNSSLIAELVEAKKAMTSLRPSVAELRDEVLATLKMANDRIAEVVSQRDGLQFVYERSLKENERAEARVAELEANAVETVLEWSKLCAARERAMRARAERAEAHVEQLQAKLHCVCGSPVDHSSMEGHSPVSMYDYALERAEAERDAMREALSFYANKRNWHTRPHCYSVAVLDCGTKACAALTPSPDDELPPFKPRVVFNEEMRVTEMLLEDCLIVWKPWGPYEGHAVDCGYSKDGRLVGIKIWDDVTSRLSPSPAGRGE